MDRRSLELAGLIMVAGIGDVAAATGLAYVAGFGQVRSVLDRVSWTWLAAMVGAPCASRSSAITPPTAVPTARNAVTTFLLAGCWPW